MLEVPGLEACTCPVLQRCSHTTSTMGREGILIYTPCYGFPKGNLC